MTGGASVGGRGISRSNPVLVAKRGFGGDHGRSPGKSLYGISHQQFGGPVGGYTCRGNQVA